VLKRLYRIPGIARLISIVTTLFGISVFVFFMLRVIPGNTITAAFGIETGMLSEDQLADLRVYYGIDKPLLAQYFSWITSFLTGNMGYSYSTGVPISTLTKMALPVTIEVAIIGTVLGFHGRFRRHVQCKEAWHYS